jgi:hypothetical protein
MSRDICLRCPATSQKAADGIRTHDLLHGKRAGRSGVFGSVMRKIVHLSCFYFAGVYARIGGVLADEEARLPIGHGFDLPDQRDRDPDLGQIPPFPVGGYGWKFEPVCESQA